MPYIADDKELVKTIPKYMNNNTLKAAGAQMPMTAEQIEELDRCMNDPIYFIETYVKIINIDKGLIPFKLYPFQSKMVEHTLNNRFTIIKTGRQQGKCGSFTTNIKIRNSEKVVHNVSIGNFYQWQAFCRDAKLLKEHYASEAISESAPMLQ